MAKKANLLEEAAKLGLDVSEKNTVAQIEAAIVDAQAPAVEAAVIEQLEEENPTGDVKVAKAGKRSAKASSGYPMHYIYQNKYSYNYAARESAYF